MPVPWSIAAPAALATASYLNAKYLITQDLTVISTIVEYGLKGKRYDRKGIANYFFRLEERAQSKEDANRLFLIYEGQRWTFKEGYDMALRYGTWLRNTYGIRPQEMVALDFTNAPKFIFMILGLWAIGAYPALINYNLTSKALLHCIKVSNARYVFVDDEIAHNFSTEVKDALAAKDFQEGGKGPVEAVVVDFELENRIALTPAVRAPESVWEGQGVNENNRTAMLIFTSGTTGLPKAAIVPWVKAYGATAFNQRWMGVRKDDIYYTCMPLYHGTANLMAFCPSFIMGYTLALGHRFSNKTFWPDVHNSGATVIQYVGETCRYLLAAPPYLDPKTGANLDKSNNVRIAFGNGLRPDVWERFRNRFDIPNIAEFYSATEGPGAMWNLSRNTWSSGAIGRAGPIARLLARSMGRGSAIVRYDFESDTPWRDPSNHSFCERVPLNTPGELLYQLDPKDIEAQYLGYYGNTKASTSKLMRDVFKPGDAWFRTGDTLRIDGEGRAFFVDRIGDTYRWRSENVSTNEVSEVLGTHPAISEANVYGVELPHHDGRAGCAAITLHGGAEPTRELMRDIAAHALRGLPKFAVPVFVRVMRALEATGNNKQQKQGLRVQGVDPEKMGGEEKVFWLQKGGYEEYGVGEWEGIRRGEVRL